MRMRPALLIGAVAIVLPLSALAPVWATTPTGPVVSEDDAHQVPGLLFDRLIEVCQEAIPLGPDQMVLPNWFESDEDDNSRVWLELYEFDPEGEYLEVVEPSSEQAEHLAAANQCLASYTMEEWREPAQFDEFHRNMYYEYVVGPLVSCLAARGIDAPIPTREAFKRLDVDTWYQVRLVGLDFHEALSIWQNCPPVPEYLVAAGNPRAPVEVLLP